MNIPSIFVRIIDRAIEPSTWAGTGVLAAVVHSIAPGALGDGVLAAGAAICGLIAIVAPERKPA
ncbi:hypothetical protein [Methylosinus sporium]|nr:hypothetical protein [Methylosinus sporium]